jgi:hypothetical protein
VLQRFGSDLRLNPHFHMLVLDGGYVRDEATGLVRFHKTPAPSTEDVERVAEQIAIKSAAWLRRQGVEDFQEPDPDDLQLTLQAAAVAGRSALSKRAVQRARRVQTLGGRRFALPPRCASVDGFNVHAGVVIAASDRKGLERICRYLARPPLGRERLERTDSGDLFIRFKRAWRDGTTGIVLSPAALLERLAALVPPPRAHTVTYHGVLAGHSALRAAIVPNPPKRSCHGVLRSPRLPLPGPGPHRLHWADLLARVFAVDAFACPRCDGRMVVRAVVLPGGAAFTVLRGLQQSARGPPGERFDAA